MVSPRDIPWYWRTAEVSPYYVEDRGSYIARWQDQGDQFRCVMGPTRGAHPYIGALYIATPPFGRKALIDRVVLSGHMLSIRGRIASVGDWLAENPPKDFYAFMPDHLLVGRDFSGIPTQPEFDANIIGNVQGWMNAITWIGIDTNVIARTASMQRFMAEPFQATPQSVVGAKRVIYNLPSFNGGLITFEMEPYEVAVGERLIIFTPWLTSTNHTPNFTRQPWKYYLNYHVRDLY